MGLIDALEPGPVAVDTAVFIYLIEEHPRFLPPLIPLFDAADAGKRQLVTSAVTLLEVLVVPYRRDDADLAARYEAVLTSSRGTTMVEIDRLQLRTAVRLRAVTGIRTPDALQMAAAVASGCRTLVTNDRRLPALPSLRILHLSDYC